LINQRIRDTPVKKRDAKTPQGETSEEAWQFVRGNGTDSCEYQQCSLTELINLLVRLLIFYKATTYYSGGFKHEHLCIVKKNVRY
jgi:hypothetical protein